MLQAVPSTQVYYQYIKYKNALKAINAAISVSAKQRETLKKAKINKTAMRIGLSASDNAKFEIIVLPERCTA